MLLGDKIKSNHIPALNFGLHLPLNQIPPFDRCWTLTSCFLFSQPTSAHFWSELLFQTSAADWHQVDLYARRCCHFDRSAHCKALQGWSLTHRQLLGNNGPDDGWWRRVCPLSRPINLDEALTAPSQISSVLLSPPHFKMEKSCYSSCGRFLAVYTAEGRNIYSMAYVDVSVQFISFWQEIVYPFPSWGN